MKKRYTKIAAYGFVLLLMSFVIGQIFMTKQVSAYPYQMMKVTTKRIVVKNKGYLKVTSNRYVNQILFRGKVGNQKDYQTSYDMESRFAVTKGIYYLQISSISDCKVKCKFKPAPKDYKKNISMETATLLKPEKVKVALSYRTDRKVNHDRYYKIIAKKDERIQFTGGTLLDCEGNELPQIMQRFIRPVYASKNEKAGSEWMNKAYGIHAIGEASGISISADPLETGKIYYIKASLLNENWIMEKDKKKNQKSVSNAIKVSYKYLGTNTIAPFTTS